MIRKGQVCIRLKAGTNNIKHPKGLIFEAVRDHATHAFYTEALSLASGYFAQANAEEIAAYRKGIRNTSEINYKETSTLESLKNDLLAKEKNMAPGEEVEKKIDGRKTSKKRVENMRRWTKQDIFTLVGYCRGAKSFSIGYKKAAKVLGRSEMSTAQMWNRIKNGPPKILKKFKITPATFVSIPAIKESAKPITEIAPMTKKERRDDDVIHGSLVLQAMVLLSNKLNNKEKLLLVDHMID